MYAIEAGGFPVCYYFQCCLEPVGEYVHLTAFFDHSQLCFHVVYPFDIFVMIFPFPYFTRKSSCLLVVDIASPILPLIVGRIFSLLWNFLFCLNRLVLSPYLLSFPSFAGVFLVDLKLFFLCSSCRACSVSSEYFLMFRYSILACCRSLLICDSSHRSRPGFEFLSVVFKGTLIFSQTNFAPAYIKSCNSVMSFVGIFVNKSFTFSVSDLTVLQSGFLREGNVVFFSDMILLMVSLLVFSLLDHCLRLCVDGTWVIVM